MNKILSIVLFLSTISQATDVVHDETYYKHTNENTEIIFSKDNLEFANRTNAIEPEIHKHYEKSFNWKLDDTLYVGLLSHRNQIPNGYSTQWPINRQINYIGGAQNIDYFSSTSWLDTLLYHESAHNYQTNVKASWFSRFFHSIFGNGFLYGLPLSVPNVMENSFLLEGNAVLNESWHGNGGRLYSGRFKAQTILQAKAGRITPELTYNTTLNFPYSETYYITGGFYHLYMAEKYGLYNLNRYFYEHSKDFLWPQFTDSSMKNATGEFFEESLQEFADEYASKPLNIAKGLKIASSQYYYQLNNDKDEIFFINNEDGHSAPKLVTIDKKTLKTDTTRGSWLGGKVIKKDNNYYTLASSYTSAFNIHQGLYDSDAKILDSSKSKIIQGYLSNGTEVYFDVKTSFAEAQLYVGDKFYTRANSSIYIDKDDNLYYFKQFGKTRILYRNKKPIYKYKGFYGIVSDVDSRGRIYFIANSKNGSTLYRYSRAKVTRVHEADNIIEAKLVNDKMVLLSAVGVDEYYYVIDDLRNFKYTPYETKLFFEDMPYYAAANYHNLKGKERPIELSEEYNSLLDMHYSGTDIYAEYRDDNSFIGNVSLVFGDPLGQNQATMFFNKNESNISIGGLSYTSNQYLLNYSIAAYSVLENNNRDDIRDNGFMAYTTIPFIKSARFYGDIGISYYEDYDADNRKPLSLHFSLSRHEKYGISMYDNYKNSLKLYGVKEREDKIYGGLYTLSHDLGYEFYGSLNAKYSQTDAQTTNYDAHINKRGVKVTNLTTTIYDTSQITIPNIYESFYFKKAGYADIQISKVINLSKYFFTFPLSLQRESIYTKYRRYELELFSGHQYTMNETTLGASIVLVGLNSLAFPLNIEYIRNDDPSGFLVRDKEIYRVILGIDF